MFSPQLPNNDLPLLPSDIDYDSVRILKALWNAKGAIWRLDVLTQFLPDKEMFLTYFAIKESVESSQIENINTDVETMYEATRLEEKFMNKSQKEVMYYKDALMLWTALVNKQWFIATRDFEKMAKVLSPSKWNLRRWEPVVIKENGTKIIYTPPASWIPLNNLLRNFDDYYNNMIEHQIDPLIKMALIHYQFEAIHPFCDWNGRTWRILMVLHLVINKYLEFPIIFLSWFINKHRWTYYKLLMEVTTKWNRESFIVFLLNAIETQSLETIWDIGKIRKLRKEFVTTIENDSVIKSIYAENLSSVLISKPKLLRDDLKSFWSVNTITKYLKQLIKIWILKESWSVWNNNKVYTNIKFIKLIQ